MGVSHAIDRIEVTFDDETLVADVGLIVPALMIQLGLEAVVNQTVRLVGRVGGALPGRKVLTLVAAILAGGSHIDHANPRRPRPHPSPVGGSRLGARLGWPRCEERPSESSLYDEVDRVAPLTGSKS